MCQRRGLTLPWDMPTYAQMAMRNATGVQEGIYREFPQLHIPWERLYREKRDAYAELVETEGAALMPGVEPLLRDLEKKGIQRCVVTHSPRAHIEMIKARQPILQTIPHWITREDYTKPKPDGECYQLAVTRLAKEGDRVIGFEDSPRGLQALLETEADAMLISEWFGRDALPGARPFTHHHTLPTP